MMQTNYDAYNVNDLKPPDRKPQLVEDLGKIITAVLGCAIDISSGATTQ